jgi:hypothetical protein
VRELVLGDFLHELAQIVVLPRHLPPATDSAWLRSGVGVAHAPPGSAAQVVLGFQRLQIQREIEDVGVSRPAGNSAFA